MRTRIAQTKTLDNNSRSSDPGLVVPDWEKVRRLQPGLFPSLLWKLTHRELVGKVSAALDAHRRAFVQRRLACGSCVEPCVVAAYTDELDCVALLSFPSQAARELALERGSRLLTVNTYSKRKNGVVSDLTPGKADLGNYGNFSPFIAEFYSNDFERINDRKTAIAEQEFRTAERMGHEALKRGVVPRDGRTLHCWRPAKPKP